MTRVAVTIRADGRRSKYAMSPSEAPESWREAFVVAMTGVFSRSAVNRRQDLINSREINSVSGEDAKRETGRPTHGLNSRPGNH